MDSRELAWNIRSTAIELVHAVKASHIGPILSVTDIVSVLYADIMNYNPAEPKWPGRDRFVLSKGHSGLAVYIALSRCGFFSREFLMNYYRDGSPLSGHVSHKGVPGVEASTGALGHGVCMAAGMALAAKRDNKKHHVYSVMGDGECDEGSVWEMALFANHHCLNNFTVIIDHNKMQSLCRCEDTLDFIDLAQKWRSFGWAVRETDGHDHKQLKKTLSGKRAAGPVCVIAHTVKGKGVSFMENNILWHYRDPQGELYDRAVREIQAAKP